MDNSVRYGKGGFITRELIADPLLAGIVFLSRSVAMRGFLGIGRFLKSGNCRGDGQREAAVRDKLWVTTRAI